MDEIRFKKEEKYLENYTILKEVVLRNINVGEYFLYVYDNESQPRLYVKVQNTTAKGYYCVGTPRGTLEPYKATFLCPDTTVVKRVEKGKTISILI